MCIRWLLVGVLLIGLLACPSQAGAFDWLFGTTSEETIAEASTNDSITSTWSNGTATIESLDTTTGEVVIHYTMEYIPANGGITVKLINNHTTAPEWSGDAHELDGTWKFCLKDSYYSLDAPDSFPDGYTAVLVRNEVGI